MATTARCLATPPSAPKGETARAGGNEIQPYLTGVPVSIGGVTVVPGDYIFAQGSAAVVIPASSTEAILGQAREIMNNMNLAKELTQIEDPKKVLAQGSSEI